MKPFQAVKLLTDKYISEGIRIGDIGYILEGYDGENFEVEFSDKDGITIALHSFHKDEIQLCEDIQELEVNEDQDSYEIDDSDLADIKNEREAKERSIRLTKRKKQIKSYWITVVFYFALFGTGLTIGLFRNRFSITAYCFSWLGFAVVAAIYSIYKLYKRNDGKNN